MSDALRCDNVWHGKRCSLRKGHFESHQYGLDDEGEQCPHEDFNPNTMARQRCRLAKGHLGPHQYR